MTGTFGHCHSNNTVKGHLQLIDLLARRLESERERENCKIENENKSRGQKTMPSFFAATLHTLVLCTSKASFCNSAFCNTLLQHPVARCRGHKFVNSCAICHWPLSNWPPREQEQERKRINQSAVHQLSIFFQTVQLDQCCWIEARKKVEANPQLPLGFGFGFTDCCQPVIP